MTGDVPVNTRIVVETAENRWAVVSKHAGQEATEVECCRRNAELSCSRFNAYIVIKLIAERMARACR